MASVIEDAETYQQSSSIVSPYHLDPNNDLVPLTNPSTDHSSMRRSSTMGQTSRGSSTIGSIFLLINAALGAGLLNFPKAFNDAGGIEIALAVQAVLLLFVIVSLLILAKCSDINGALTVQDVLHGASGKMGQHVGSFCVAIYSFGTCITFLIIIGDQFDRSLASLYGTNFCQYWYMRREFLICASSVVFILPMCFSRRIDFLKYVSSVGVLSIIYVVALIVFEYSEGNHPVVRVKTQPDTWTDVFLVVPVICFGYQCHVSAVPIYSCMRERNVKNFTVTVLTALLVCLLAYTAAGTCGYLTFGMDVPGDILEGYDANKPYVLVAIIALAAKSCTTYPLLAFCGREAIMSLFQDCFHSTRPHTEKVCRTLISFVWFATSLFLAVLIPDIGEVIQVLGSLAAVFIFVFPGLCLLQLTLRQDPAMIRKKHLVFCFGGCCMIVIGTFLFGLVLTQAIQSDISPRQHSDYLCNITKLTQFRMSNM